MPTDAECALLWRGTCRHEAAHAVATSYFSRRFELALPADGITCIEVPSRAEHDAKIASFQAGPLSSPLANMAQVTWDANGWLHRAREKMGIDATCSAMVVRSLAGPAAEQRYLSRKAPRWRLTLREVLERQPHNDLDQESYMAAVGKGMDLTDMDYARHFASLAGLDFLQCVKLTRDFVQTAGRNIEALGRGLEQQPKMSGAEAVAAMKW